MVEGFLNSPTDVTFVLSHAEMSFHVVPGVSQLSRCKVADLTHERLGSCKIKASTFLEETRSSNSQKTPLLFFYGINVWLDFTCDFEVSYWPRVPALICFVATIWGKIPKRMPLFNPHKTSFTLQVPSSSSFTLHLSLSLSFISYLLFLCLWMRKLDSKGQGEYVNQFCVRSLPPIPSLKH